MIQQQISESKTKNTPAPADCRASAVQLKDNREHSVVQLKLSEKNNALESSSIPIQKKNNHTGLPDNLKSGIENLSGHSMDDVKVNYNSDKPAQLQAHAFAQGTNIHIASGQEKHLPHEAWHVVQQKQGRVKPNLQMKGKMNINDDKGLEKEADVMGSLSLKSNNSSKNRSAKNTHSNTIQRVISVKVNKEDKYKAAFNDYLDKLNTATQKAYFYVIHYPDLKAYAQLDGHTEYWVETWKNYTAGKEKGLLHAAFGYAVETLATIIYLPSPEAGLSTELQGIRAGTRPDVVLKDQSNDVGWLDITASDSALHVWNKAGWESKDIHKGEVTYPSLNPQIIKDNVLHKREYNDHTDPRAILDRINYLKYIQDLRRRHWRHIGEKYFGTPLHGNNQTEKRQYIRERVAAYLGLNYYDLPPQALGSVLYAMGQGIEKHGYKNAKGKSRALGESILQEHDRELPGIENFSAAVMKNITENSKSEIAAKFEAHSGQSGFNPAFHYNPSLPDESSLVVHDKGSLQIVGLAKRYRSYLDTPFDLNYLEIRSLFLGMKKSMRENAIKGFGLKIRLQDGTIGTLRLDEMTSRSLKSYYSNAIRLQKYRTNRKNKNIWDKRRKITHSSREQLVISRGLSPYPIASHSVDTEENELLTIPLSFQVIGFGFQFENGQGLIVSSPGDFQQQLHNSNSDKSIQ